MPHYPSVPRVTSPVRLGPGLALLANLPGTVLGTKQTLGQHLWEQRYCLGWQDSACFSSLVGKRAKIAPFPASEWVGRDRGAGGCWPRQAERALEEA